MSKNQNRIWPTGKEDLLLRAVFLSGKDALNAWKRWQTYITNDSFDSVSYQLFSLLYKNLHDLGENSFLIKKLKGIYRLTWYKNQLILKDLSSLIRALHDAGVQTMVLKTAALQLLNADDHASRPLNGLAILVKERALPECYEALKRLGWRTKHVLPDASIPFNHAAMFETEGGAEKIHLHWHVLPEACQSSADDIFWRGAVPITLGNMAALALNPTDQLLCLCADGARWPSAPALFWIADAMVLLKGHNATIDWDRLYCQMEKLCLVAPVQHALIYLHDRLGAPIPSPQMRKIKQMPVSIWERWDYRYRQQDDQRRLLGNLPVLCFDYLRRTHEQKGLRKVWGFADYLTRFWDLTHYGQIPRTVFRITRRRLRTVLIKR